MKRETSKSDLYLFYYPLYEDGINYGNLSESIYVGNLRNYGSTSNTASFNDNLLFDDRYGELSHIHRDNKDKLVAIIDKDNLNLSNWLNKNDWEFNIDFYFTGYNSYPQVFEMHRNGYLAENVYCGFDIRNNGNIYLYRYEETTIPFQNVPTVNNEWTRITMAKKKNVVNCSLTRIEDGFLYYSMDEDFLELDETIKAE